MPTEGLYRYHGHLIRFLKGVALRLRLLTALESLLLLASYIILILLGSLFVQELKSIFPYLPFLFYLLGITFFIFSVILRTYRVALRPPMDRVARALEQKFPQLKDDVTNSLLLFDQLKKGFDSGQISEGLVIAHLRKTAEKVSDISPGQIVNFKRALRHLRLFLPLSVAFLTFLALDPHFLARSMGTILHPFSSLPMRETTLAVEPGGSIILRGSSLAIKATATGYVPDRLRLMIWPETGDTVQLNMESEGEGRFVYRIASVQTSFRYQASSGRASSPVSTVRVVDPPEIGKMMLTLVPPDYTHLPKEITHEGHIEALKGTVVNLEAETNKGVKEGRILLNQKDQLALHVQGDRLTGSLLVFYPGTYSIHVKDDLGFENLNPVEYRIHLIPDKYPEGEILDPAEDIEVSGTEIIPIVYTAKDDFGITEVRLSYQIGETERFITLKSVNSGRPLSPETFRWDLTGLALMPGDRVVCRLEIWDNDAVSGPKAGYSRALSFYVKDERDRAAQEVEEAQQLADALLGLLADQLEESKDRQELSGEITKILEQVDKHLARMGEEKIQRFDLEALQRNLESLHQRIQEEPKETITREMERLALLAEDIAKKTRMDEVEALAREIRNRERRLMDALRDHQGPLTPNVLEAMMKELEKLKQLLNTVMEALSRMATQLPDEFINSSELSGLEFQDLFKDLDDIQKNLMAGDLAAALEAAQQLLQTLSEMMAALARAGAQASMGSFDRLQSEMSHQSSELEKILGEQKEILTGTEGVDRELKRRLEDEIEERLKDSLAQFQETLEELRRSLPSEQGDAITELERLLKDGQLDKFSQLIQILEKDLSGRPEMQKRIEAMKQMLENLLPDPNEVMTSQDKEKFPGLSSRQDKLEKRTETLAEKLEMLSQLFPGMDTDILNDLKEAAESMGKASGRLGEEDAPGAIPPEEEAIQSLSKSQQAMQQMSQQMAMRMQANRWGYPLAYDPRPGWYYGPWVPMPTLPQPELRRPREKGRTGLDREEFEPPSKDAYKAPQILREKVMDALKEGIPPQYRREVERYFRGLTE